MSENKMATKEDLKEFYNRIYPYLGGSAAAGFTPVGTVIPMIAETAPANYLICDGAAYNKSDYPELSAHLLSMTNHSMYEVSGDSTKFKVPDLRGEFLRGTGTNGHTSEGSGAAVGVHQNGTSIPNIAPWSSTSSNYVLQGFTDANGNSYGIENSDGGARGTTAHRSVFNTSSRDTSGSGQNLSIKLRPTNTSVLFCIATKNIYLNPSLDYSTDEKVVGTWIDGKPIYQKTFVDTVADSKHISLVDINYDKIIDFNAIMEAPTDGTFQKLGSTLISDDGNNRAKCYISLSASYGYNIAIINTNSAWNDRPIYITIQYTKTTA